MISSAVCISIWRIAPGLSNSVPAGPTGTHLVTEGDAGELDIVTEGDAGTNTIDTEGN